jgi:hypothetical protein
VNTLTKRKTYKRQYVRAEKTLTISKVSNLIAKKKGSSCKKGETPANRVRAERRCSYCSEIRHNSRTYKIEIEDVVLRSRTYQNRGWAGYKRRVINEALHKDLVGCKLSLASASYKSYDAKDDPTL